MDNRTEELLSNYATSTNLRGADLRGTNLRGANLYGANLYGANLRGANLRGADLYGADLYGADLCGANLHGADLRGADLRGANLRGANLRGVLLGEFRLTSNHVCSYTGIDYHCLIFANIIQIGCEVHHVKEWQDFTDKEILRMDGKRALKFWRKEKRTIMQISNNILTNAE